MSSALACAGGAPVSARSRGFFAPSPPASFSRPRALPSIFPCLSLRKCLVAGFEFNRSLSLSVVSRCHLRGVFRMDGDSGDSSSSSDSLRVSDLRSVPRTLREFLPSIVLSSGKLLRPLRLPHYILGHGNCSVYHWRCDIGGAQRKWQTAE